MKHKQVAAIEGIPDDVTIRLYRRHGVHCDKDPAFMNCDCLLWVQYQRNGKQMRESCKTRNREEAFALVKRIAKELSGSVPAQQDSIADAIENWLQDRRKQKIDNKKAIAMSRRFLDYCQAHRLTTLLQVTRQHLNAFKRTLNFASGNSNSLRVHLSVLGNFFRWAVEEEGILDANPFPKSKLKFEPDDVSIPTTEEINRVLAIPSVRLFASLMRWSGMAIQDAATLQRSCLVGTEISGRRCKTGKKFRVHIPAGLADELREIPPKDARYFFWDGRIQAESVAEQYRLLLRKAFEQAGVDMTPHGFRHYFITQALATGVPLGDVAQMAGNSAAEIAKTYMHDSEETKKRSREMAQKMWAAQGLDQHGNPV